MNNLHEASSYLPLIQSAQNLHEGVLISDASNTIIWVNPSFTRITGYKFEEVIGKSPSLLNSRIHSMEFYSDLWRDLLEKGYWKGLICNKRKNNEYYHEFLSIYTSYNKNGEVEYYFAIFLNTYDFLEENSKSTIFDYYDSLTYLPNRNKFYGDVQELLVSYQSNKNKFAILFLNVDRFKYINDSLGYSAGDEFLIQFSRRFRKSFDEKFNIYRFSGDDFVIVFPFLKEEEEIYEIREQTSKLLLEPFYINGEHFKVTVSIGVSIYPDQGRDVKTLKKKAILALHNAKKLGINQLMLYHHSIGDTTTRRFQIERELQTALENQEISIVFQPQVCLNSTKIIGYEALIRWTHPTLGAISPGEFIPIAEETGIIIEIGEWVLRNAIIQKMNVNNASFRKMDLSVNVSAIQLFDIHFVNVVRCILQETNYPPEKLTIEITETAVMKDLDCCAEILRILRGIGIKISLDDFGVGFSSINHLKLLPLDSVKIDRSFIANLAKDKLNYSIVKSILDLARVKEMDVVAEGIEGVEELITLLHLKCPLGQGYYFSKPFPFNDKGLNVQDTIFQKVNI